MEKFKQAIKRKFPILVKVKHFLYSAIIKNKLEFIELPVVDICNLNCKACTSFSNISRLPNFADARMLAIMLGKLSEIFEIENVRILGGEPLLHPDLINVLQKVRQSLPDSRIELVTNGILLGKMSKEFFETCLSNNIFINISYYPVLQNKSDIEEILSSYRINYEISPVVFTFTANLNPKGNSDKAETFKNCRYAYYKTLKNDYIYTCPICANIDKYNKYFNKDIPAGKGINIYTNSRRQIFQYLRNPEETCRYCTNLTRFMDWEHSKNPEETDWYGRTDS